MPKNDSLNGTTLPLRKIRQRESAVPKHRYGRYQIADIINLFIDKNGKYKRNDTDMYKWDYDPKEIKISRNINLWKFKRKPDYYLLGLIEWGYYFNLEFGECYWSYDFYKEQMSRLGGYCKVVFPMYDK